MTISEIAAKVAEIYNQEMAQGAVARFFALNQIPGKKLNNAIGSYAATGDKDEYVLYLYDATDLGSAKDGFLLNNKRLYFKNFGAGGIYIELANILDFMFKPALITSTIAVRTDLQVPVWEINIPGINKKDAGKLINVLNNTLAFLKNSSTASTGNTDQTLAQAQSGRAVVCKSCGANYVTGSKICDYCGAPLQ